MVEFRPVKFWRVVEPRESRLVREPRDVSDEAKTFEARVAPVSDPAGADPMRVPVRLPVAEVKKRLVVEAVVAKKLVVVALVPVALVKVRSWRVEDPVTKRLERVVRPEVIPTVPGKT